MIGKTLGGRYSIIRQLGRGGFSDTYLAIDKQLPKTPYCVVKRLKSQSTDTTTLKTVRRLFDAEAAILYELGRKNDQIPRLLAHFEEEKEFYLVQEFIEGEDLSLELTPGSSFSEGQVIILLQDILNVLKFVHQQGVIHRDIKPRNLIRREEDSRIVLIDFGAVKQISTQILGLQGEGQTTATIAIGTPGYMPNEQQGGKPRFSSDIYAVGMIAIQALTGLPPHDLQEDPQTGEIIWREHAQVSRRFADIIDRMVRTHFIDRYRSVEEVLIDLHRLQEVTPLNLKPVVAAMNSLSGHQKTRSHALEPRPTTISNPGLQALTASTPGWLSATGNPWVMAGVVLACSLIGYGYWHSYSIPSSKATTSQIVSAQTNASPEAFTLAKTLPVQAGAVFAIAVSPDGKTFASGTEDKAVRIWDSQTGEVLQTLAGHTAEVVSVAMSPDGQTLASGSRDNTVRLWNLKTGKLTHTLNHLDWVESVAFTPNGKMLAAGNRAKTVTVWDTKTGKLLCDFEGHSAEVESVAISADGKFLAGGSGDKTIRVWSLETERRVHTLAQHADTVESMAISPDGQTLISGGLDKTFIWNLRTGKVLRTLPESSGLVRSLAVYPDGKTLMSSHQDNTIKLWNLQTGELLRTLSGHLDWVLSVAVSPDGKTLVSGSRDTTIKIWRMP